jgi:hypothetical protein
MDQASVALCHVRTSEAEKIGSPTLWREVAPSETLETQILGFLLSQVCNSLDQVYHPYYGQHSILTDERRRMRASDSVVGFSLIFSLKDVKR